MDFFTNLLSKLQKGASNYKRDAQRVDRQRADRLVNIANKVPRFDFQTPTDTVFGDTPARPLTMFGAAILESLANTPSSIARGYTGIRQTASRGVNPLQRPQEYIRPAAELGEGLLNVATLGVTGATAKQIGKQSVKELLKRSAKTGAKYGAGYGYLSGVRDPNVQDSFIDQQKAGLFGAGQGAVVGAVLAPTLTGSGVLAKRGYGAYKASRFADERGFIKPDEFGPKKVGDILEKRRQPVKPSGKNLLKEDYRNEFMSQGPKTFDNQKFEKWWGVLEKNLSEDELVTGLNAGLIANRGSQGGIKKVQEWLKMKLSQKGVAPKTYREWEDAFFESVGAKSESVLPVSRAEREFYEKRGEIPISKAVDEVPVTSETPISPKAQAKPATWKNELAQLDDEFQQRIFEIRERLETKGFNSENAWKILHGDMPVPNIVKQEVKDYDELLKSYASLAGKKPGEAMGKIDRYAPEKWEDEGLEQIGDTFFDRLSAQFKSLLPRTGRGEGFIKDPYFAAVKYKEEALYERFRPKIESEKRGVSEEIIKAEDELITKLVEASDNPKKLKNMPILDEFLELGRKQGKKIEDVDLDYSWTKHIGRDYWVKLKNTGIYHDSGFADVSRALGEAGNYFQKNVRDFIRNGDQATVLTALGKLNIKYSSQRLSRLMNEGKTVEAEAYVHESLRRHFRGQGIEKLKEYLMTHKFHGNLKADVENLSKEIFSSEFKRQEAINAILGGIRGMVYRGALGLNIRPAVNNILETRRGVAIGSTQDWTEALAHVMGKRGNYKDILQRYGVTPGKNIQDIIDQTYGRGSFSKAIETVDQEVLFRFFNGSEAYKDALLLRVFENMADRKGLVGAKKFDFVMNKFEYYGHKYGTFGTVGLFNNQLSKTLFQFSQYAFKEMGLYKDHISEALANSTGHRKDAVWYLTKLTGQNAVLITALGALYGATAEEIFGAIPFNIRTQGEKISFNFSPIMGLAQDIGFGVINEKERAEREGEEFDLLASVDRSGKRALATAVIPGGSQLINKTGIQEIIGGPVDDFFTDSTLSDMERGFNPTASGRVRFLAPQTTKDKAIGLAFGPYSTDEAQNYFGNDERALGANQTENFKTLFGIDPQAAVNYFKGLHARRDEEQNEKKLLKDVLKGKLPEEAMGNSALANYPVSNNSPKTIGDVITKEKEESDKRSLIKKILYGEEYQTLSDQQKMMFLSKNNISQEDINSYHIYEFRNSSVEDRASLIIQSGSPNWAELYKNDILSLEVAKELERKGFIPDAEDLWNKVKMTDVYYQKKAIKDILEKHQKKIESINRSANNKMVSAVRQSFRTSKKTYKPKKWKRVKPPSIKTILSKKAPEINRKKYKKVKVTF